MIALFLFWRKRFNFALWYLVDQKKINPLVVRFDHNFLRSTVQKNTQKTLSKLKVDFIDFKPNFKIIQKTMLESLKEEEIFVGIVMLVLLLFRSILL